MRIVKALLGLFLLFVVAILAIGLVLPKKETITVSKSTKSDLNCLYTKVNILSLWPSWSPWNEYDPNMAITYNNISSGTGASYSWKGNKKVGYGSLTITNSIPNQSIDMDLNFQDYGTNKTHFVFSNTNGTNQISWSMDQEYSTNSIIKAFFGGYQYIIGKFFMSKDFSKGLDKLEATCSQK